MLKSNCLNFPTNSQTSFQYNYSLKSEKINCNSLPFSALIAAYKYNEICNNLNQNKQIGSSDITDNLRDTQKNQQDFQQSYTNSLVKYMSIYYKKPIEYIQRLLIEQNNFLNKNITADSNDVSSQIDLKSQLNADLSNYHDTNRIQSQLNNQNLNSYHILNRYHPYNKDFQEKRENDEYHFNQELSFKANQIKTKNFKISSKSKIKSKFSSGDISSNSKLKKQDLMPRNEDCFSKMSKQEISCSLQKKSIRENYLRKNKRPSSTDNGASPIRLNHSPSSN
jgi:hypothetical protein